MPLWWFISVLSCLQYMLYHDLQQQWIWIWIWCTGSERIRCHNLLDPAALILSDLFNFHLPNSHSSSRLYSYALLHLTKSTSTAHQVYTYNPLSLLLQLTKFTATSHQVYSYSSPSLLLLSTKSTSTSHQVYRLTKSTSTPHQVYSYSSPSLLLQPTTHQVYSDISTLTSHQALSYTTPSLLLNLSKSTLPPLATTTHY